MNLKQQKKENHNKNSIKCLPIVFLSNIQSFGKSEKTDKTLETEEILRLNNVEIAVFTETWLCKATADRLPFKEYQKFHLIRDNVVRSSGGVSVFVKNKLPASKLKVQVPENLECLWVTIRPKWLPRSVSNIIVCGIYYPGSNSIYSPCQDDLIFHLTTTVQYLKRIYVSPLFLMMGDFNDLLTSSIRTLCDFKQVVKVPTRGNAILDLIFTNRNNELYDEPLNLPKIGDGDHFPILYKPKIYKAPRSFKKVIKVRRYPDSAKRGFGTWISNADWSILNNLPVVNDRVGIVSTLTWDMVNQFFPLTNFVISSTDKEWVTPKIKDLFTKRQKAHMEGKFDLRDSLAKNIKYEIKKAKVEFNDSKKEFYEKTNPKEWFKHINNIINNGKYSEINLTNIPELSDKTPSEQNIIINDYFAKICRKYPELKIDQIQEGILENKPLSNVRVSNI